MRRDRRSRRCRERRTRGPRRGSHERVRRRTASPPPLARARASRVRGRSTNARPAFAPYPRSPRRPPAIPATASRPLPEVAGRRIHSRAPPLPASRLRGLRIRTRSRPLRSPGKEYAAPNALVLPIVETRDLRKVFRSRKRTPGALGALRSLFSTQFEDRVAVDNVTFAIEPGELVGYIGPNGAGKSTTIKMLTGILVPTSGEVRVAGLTPWKRRKENARNIGVVFGQRSQLYWDLPLVESFELLRAIYGVPADQYRRNMREFVEILEMGDFMRTPVRQLSLGQRMRGDFAAALLHDPPIVYLDEPTIGLDVVAKEAIREFIARINAQRGATIILTTHDLADVERLCRRIVLIDEGTLIYDGDIERIKRKYGRFRTLIVRFSEPIAQPQLDGAELTAVEDHTARFRFDRNLQHADLLVRQASERYRVEDVSLEEPGLESIIRRIYVEGYNRQSQEDAS